MESSITIPNTLYMVNPSHYSVVHGIVRNIIMQTHFGTGTLITFFSGMGFRFSSELLRAFTASLTA